MEEQRKYMILRCEACGQLHILHKQSMREGLSCGVCQKGPMVPQGYAIVMDKRPADITLKVEVDTSDLDKVQKLVDEIDGTVNGMIKGLTKMRGELKGGADL